MTADLALETHDLCRRFGGRLVLDHVTLSIPRGGVHAVVGRNGAGKSTLFQVLLGFMPATSGASRLLGVDSADLPPAVRGRIACVGEGHPLPGWMRVGELTAMQRALHPRWNEKLFREVADAFQTQLPGRQKVAELSRGERAGLALALAIATGPELLLLDEPTLGLDVVASRALLESLLFAGGRQLETIVFSSHQMADVERIADQLIVLDRGRLLAVETPENLRARITAWSASWPEGRPVDAIPGLLDARHIDGELHAVVLDAAADFPARLEALGAIGVAPAPIGFERSMDALLGAGDRVGRLGRPN
jgi:ABC-2 type transport system ATP-binding protein